MQIDTVRRMHRSRAYAVLIDTPEAEAEAAAAFWSAALGARAESVPSEPQFTTLHDALPGGLVTYVQAIDDAPRFHIDIETDDVGAETERLRAVGAVQIAQWLECRVLRAPGGHLLAYANVWP
jgi:predicted enzyme related to lactoylglutathione lyase